MALLIRADGTKEIVLPANRVSFTLAELQGLVGGYIQIVPTLDGLLMVVNGDGKLKGLPPNAAASLRYAYSSHDGIVGDAVVGTRAELGEEDEEEELDDG